jgi:pyrimidine-nucleoside phosphorylase
MLLGAGRATKEAAIDYAVGLTLRKKVGDQVSPGDTIAVLHVREQNETVRQVVEKVRGAYDVRAEQPAERPLLLSVVTSDGIKRFI